MLKEDLWRFRDLSEECERLAERITRKELKLGSVSVPQITDNPQTRSGKRSDFTDEVHNLEDMRAEHKKLCNLRDESYIVINNAIALMTAATTKAVS